MTTNGGLFLRPDPSRVVPSHHVGVFEHLYDPAMGISQRYGALPSLSRSGPPPVKHVLVNNPPGEQPGTYPGLLVEWRNDAGSWLARVIYLVPGSTTDVVTERWLLAERLSPVHSDIRI